MTKDRVALVELLDKSAEADFIGEMLGFVADRLMALEKENKELRRSCLRRTAKSLSVCVNRRSLPSIPSEGCQPNRSKAATRWVISTQGLHCYSERAVPVNFAWRFRMDSPLRLIL